MISNEILERMVDITGDDIGIGDLIAYAVKEDSKSKRLVIRLAVVTGSHYGGKDDSLLLNIRRVDGRRVGQMKPEMIDGVWTFNRVTIVSRDNGGIIRDEVRKECARIVVGYMNSQMNEDVNDMLRDIRDHILNGYRRRTRKYHLVPEETKTRFKVHDESRSRLNPKRRRSECPKCGWAMVPVDEYGNRDKDGKVYQCLKDDCKYREEV